VIQAQISIQKALFLHVFAHLLYLIFYVEVKQNSLTEFADNYDELT